MKILPMTLVLMLSMSVAANADDGPSMVQTQRLSMDTALTIARAAIAACENKGVQVSATVVDRNGVVQVVLRNTIAAPISLLISKGKAYTAANFNNATGAMPQLANMAIGRVPGLILTAGGLPIEVGGALVAAVGVSGASSGDTDEECAQAGIDAVLDDLEMAL